MTFPSNLRDLVVLSADKNMKFTVDGLLSRYQSLGIRPITTKFYIHPESDPGCFRRADVFLRPFTRHFRHAIVIFDRDGCGEHTLTREELEHHVEEKLSRSGWDDRASALVIDPELENWVWSDSPEIDLVLGWGGRKPGLRQWLVKQGLMSSSHSKPPHPKNAMEEALRFVRKPRSSAIYLQLAQRVSFNRCVDPTFTRLKEMLASWFPAG